MTDSPSEDSEEDFLHTEQDFINKQLVSKADGLCASIVWSWMIPLFFLYHCLLVIASKWNFLVKNTNLTGNISLHDTIYN